MESVTGSVSIVSGVPRHSAGGNQCACAEKYIEPVIYGEALKASGLANENKIDTKNSKF